MALVRGGVNPVRSAEAKTALFSLMGAAEQKRDTEGASKISLSARAGTVPRRIIKTSMKTIVRFMAYSLSKPRRAGVAAPKALPEKGLHCARRTDIVALRGKTMSSNHITAP